MDVSARLDLPRLRTVITWASTQAKTLLIQHHASTIMGYATSIKKGQKAAFIRSGWVSLISSYNLMHMIPRGKDPHSVETQSYVRSIAIKMPLGLFIESQSGTGRLFITF
jgi:hypothetical protein